MLNKEDFNNLLNMASRAKLLMLIGGPVGFPSKEQVKKALKKLEKVQGTLPLPENPTPLEKFRYDIQQKFVIYKHEKRITQRQMAETLEVDEGKVSKILHNRLEEFSTDRLINLYIKLNPHAKLRVG